MRPGRPGFANIHDNVMYHPSIPRFHLHSLDPPILLETGRYRKILIFDRPRRRNLERLGHGQRQVAIQTGRPRLFRRSIPQITLLRARIYPFHKCFDLRSGERPVVRELPATRIGWPRRHLAAPHLVPNGLRPRPGFIVSAQRHRSHLPRPMAFLAAILEDGKNVAEKRNGQHHRLHTYQYICFSDSLTQDCKRRIITYIGVSRC